MPRQIIRTRRKPAHDASDFRARENARRYPFFARFFAAAFFFVLRATIVFLAGFFSFRVGRSTTIISPSG
jgi:hypothetical protein